MTTRFSIRTILVLSLLGGLFFVPQAESCPFCSSQGQTLLGEVAEANLIVFGTLSNQKLERSELGNKGTTDINIELVVKPHEILGDKKVLTIPRYIPPSDSKARKHLIFIGVTKGKLDPYRGETVKEDSKIGEYLQGSIALRDKDIPTRLTYFFKYLDSEEVAISNDAYMEFGNVDYPEYRKLAEKLDPEVVAKWLKNPNTPITRFGLYGSILGHCGKKETHAKIIREILDDPTKKFISGMDGILAGYLMIDPEAGWKYLMEILKNDKQGFLLRYAGLRTVRFFWDYRPDILDKKKCVEAVASLIEQPDIADLAVDDLRRWGRWEVSEKVFKLFERATHDIPIVKRSLVRYALCAPKEQKDAQEFLIRMRKIDSEWVDQVDELLKLELEPVKKEEKKKDK